MSAAVKAILARVGGLRGLGAAAAIAWGTSQANSIAQDAQDRVTMAEEAYANVIAMIEERGKELESVTRSYETYLDNMRQEARADMMSAIRDGKYDTAVIERANAIAAASSLPLPPGNIVLGTDTPDAKV